MIKNPKLYPVRVFDKLPKFPLKNRISDESPNPKSTGCDLHFYMRAMTESTIKRFRKLGKSIEVVL